VLRHGLAGAEAEGHVDVDADADGSISRLVRAKAPLSRRTDNIGPPNTRGRLLEFLLAEPCISITTPTQ
jgi:hypothetical protein